MWPRSRMISRIASLCIAAALAAGCAATGGHEKSTDLDKQRLMLSEGYSLLYKDASHLDLSELILYVKVESEALDQVVKAVADVGGDIKKDLERIARDYPGVR